MILLAKEKTTRPLARELIDVLDGDHAKWLLLPVLDLRVELLNGLPEVQNWLDLSLKQVHFWKVLNGESQLRLPPDNCANLCLCIRQAFLQLFHYLDPHLDVGLIPKERLSRVVFFLSPQDRFYGFSVLTRGARLELLFRLHADTAELQEGERGLLDFKLDFFSLSLYFNVDSRLLVF